MRIAYVGPFSFPASHANSLRVSGIAHALALGGAEVLIGSADYETLPFKFESVPGGISVYPLGEFPQESWPRWQRVLRGVDAGRKTARWIESLSPRPDAILVYGTPFGYLRRLLPLAKKMRVPLLLDVVEWYDPAHMPGGKFGPVSLAFEYSMRCLATKADGALVISRYLETYFNAEHIPTLRVPPLFSFTDCRPEQFREIDGGLHLCYAGTPGKKDKLETILQAMTALTGISKRVELHLVGVDNKDLIALMDGCGLKIPPVDAKVKITAYGRVDNTTAKSIVSSCDFTVLLRDQLRYSLAGFPSKVAESLMLGTPVIANLSSNLDEVFVNGRNSILLENPDAASLVGAINQAVNIDCDDLAAMKGHSRVDGARLFDLKNYAESLNGFIGQIAKQRG